MLCGLDAAGAAALVCGHFPRDVSRALQSLAPTPKLQFAFLDALMATADEAVVSGGRDASRTFVNVGDDERSLYVHLLCDFAPDRVYDYLTSHDGYDRDECLDLCRARGIPDATALLLEETGDAKGALKLVLGTLQQRFEALRAALRVANRDGRFSLHCASPLSPGGPRESPRGASRTKASAAANAGGYAAAAAESDGRAALDALPEGVAARKMLDVALRLCSNADSNATAELGNADDDDEAGGGDHEPWFATLDTLVESKRHLQLSRELPSNASLMHAMINCLVQQTLGAMSERVPLRRIVAKIFEDHADSNLGEFRHIITSMLDTSRYDARIHEIVRDIERNDAHALRERHAARMGRGVRVDVDANSVPKDAWTATRGSLLIAPPAQPGDPWTASLADDVVFDGDDLRRKRRNALVHHRTDVMALSKYDAFFKLAASDDEDVKKRALTMTLDTAPRGRKHDDHHRISTRVPGMLEVRAKFYAELPKEHALQPEDGGTTQEEDDARLARRLQAEEEAHAARGRSAQPA